MYYICPNSHDSSYRSVIQGDGKNLALLNQHFCDDPVNVGVQWETMTVTEVSVGDTLGAIAVNKPVPLCDQRQLWNDRHKVGLCAKRRGKMSSYYGVKSYMLTIKFSGSFLIWPFPYNSWMYGNGRQTHHTTEFSLESCNGLEMGVIWEELLTTNHIKASMLHLLKDQRDLLTEGPSI